MLFDDLGIETPCTTKAEYLLALNKFLIKRLEKNEPTLLIIDEAQNLSTEMLEEIRLLSNLETPTSKLIQIMLVGQPELRELLARPELRQLRQRIGLRHHLRPFELEELHDYVGERLARAGYTGKGLFKRGALQELYAVTGGTPRLVNGVCDSALLLAYSREIPLLDASMIREVAQEMELVPELDGRDGTADADRGGRTAKPRRGWLGLFR
jgi:type II secretory pathway predicted ATPase ExeA